MMMRKNDLYILDITGMNSEGEGVAKHGGFAVFVPRAILGERVEARIVKVLKNYAYGKIENIIVASPDRIAPQCAYFPRCGGCTFWHMGYEAQLEFKTNKVRETLARVGKIDTKVHDCIGMPNPLHYRNKAIFPITPDGIGFYAARSHDVIDMETCLVQEKVNDEILRAVREFMREYDIAPYDENTHAGLFRAILTRVGNGIMVAVVTNGTKFSHKAEFARKIAAIDGVVSIIQNINDKKTNLVLGAESITLFGQDKIFMKLENLHFEVGVNSFYQVNSEQMLTVYRKVREFANLSGRENVLDLYCGVGSITLFLAKDARRIIGVESVAAAIEDARANAAANGIDNAEFLLGRSEDAIEDLHEEIDVVVLDPPRKGCEEAVLRALLKLCPERIVYVSCNAATLARDLRILAEGYDVESVQPVDMFPHSHHVETIASLRRVTMPQNHKPNIFTDREK